MTIRITRLGVLAPALIAISLTATPAFADPPANGADISDKTVYLIPHSWLRYGPSLVSRLYTNNKLAMEIRGRGKCSFFACPVNHNGVELYARRSRLEMTKPSGEVVTNRSLRRGDEGEDVRILQQALNKNGAKVPVDASFGKETEMAVIDFQKKSGVTADGVVGPSTRDKLKI